MSAWLRSRAFLLLFAVSVAACAADRSPDAPAVSDAVSDDASDAASDDGPGEDTAEDVGRDELDVGVDGDRDGTTDLSDAADLSDATDLLDLADQADATDQLDLVDLAELVPLIDADASAAVHPCRDRELWPLSVESSELPLIVHHRRGERREAERVLAIAETAWRVQVDTLGFRPPLPDGARCGPDERFDAFLWRGIEVAYVDVLAPNPDTPWDDWFAYLVVDPWGYYGGEQLDITVAHELNHACQSADDWYDVPMIFEATATWAEDAVFDDDNGFYDLLVDFQSRAHWSLDRDDGYRTWYMYAAALYLHFLAERYYPDDPAFVGRMWLGMRNPSGGPNEPDFEDALDAMLRADHGVSFADSVAELALWRWYVGSRDDGRHFEEGAAFPDEAQVPTTPVPVGAGPVEVSQPPSLLGSVYLEVSGDAGAEVALVLLLDEDPAVRWSVTALPTGDGAPTALDPGASPANLRLDDDGHRIIVVTALPASSDDDPDRRRRTAYQVVAEARE